MLPVVVLMSPIGKVPASLVVTESTFFGVPMGSQGERTTIRQAARSCRRHI